MGSGWPCRCHTSFATGVDSIRHAHGPTHTANNTDPGHWQNPPVPESWWPIIREQSPAYDPRITPTYSMGVIPELFRTWPGVIRSSHPICSFAALGPNAVELTRDHDLHKEFGENSPIGRLYQLDGHVLLLGVPHGNNTSIHLAEFRATWPSKHTQPEGTAILVDGQRRWVEFDRLDLNDEDFDAIGEAYETLHNIPVHKVGQADVHFLRQRPLIDFAVEWMQTHRQ